MILVCRKCREKSHFKCFCCLNQTTRAHKVVQGLTASQQCNFYNKCTESLQLPPSVAVPSQAAALPSITTFALK